jgi:transketolase
MHFESGACHIGGNLSCLDILIVLWHKLISSNDKFILSKGHSAGALYIALWSIGILKDSDLVTFHQDDTLLAGHPLPNKIKNILFGTGSLGHGLSLSAGIALSKKIKPTKGQVFCLTSDGEWQEGSTWEALIFSCHHNLDNLTIIVDHNNLQGFGSTNDIASMSPLNKIINGFNLEVITIDGHSPEKILSALKKKQNKCRMIILETKKGNGVSFMENKMEWHYLSLNKDQYNQAIQEVDRV